jgi:hypothetical protein
MRGLLDALFYLVRRELLKEHAGRLWADEDWRMDVTDETGLILFVIHVSAMNAAAGSAQIAALSKSSSD